MDMRQWIRGSSLTLIVTLLILDVPSFLVAKEVTDLPAKEVTEPAWVQNFEGQFTPGRCPPSAPTRAYDVTAIDIDVLGDHWDYIFAGYRYALSENADEEKRNAEAQGDALDPVGLLISLEDDYIKPLVLRVQQGDCVITILRNELEEDAVSLHLHNLSMILKDTGAAVTEAGPDCAIEPGKTQVYEWYVRLDAQVGSYIFHSHVWPDQTRLGMFGAFIVEPLTEIH